MGPIRLNSREWAWTAACGIAFAPLLIAGYLLQMAGVPTDDPTRHEIVAYFTDNKAAIQTGGLLVALACLCLLAFLGALRERLEADEGGGRSVLAVAAGTLFVGLVLLGAAFTSAIPGAAEGSETFRIDPDTGELMLALSWLANTASGSVAAAGFLTAASAAASRTAVLPRWLVRTGYVSAVLSVAAIPLAPLDLLLTAVWVALASISMLRSQEQPAARTGGAAVADA